MDTRTRILVPALALLVTALGCAASGNATRPAQLGVPTSSAATEPLVDQPGPG